MNENLRKYMDDLFRTAPQNKKTLELKEELLINMDERYKDLVQKGSSEEDAFKQVISRMGDIDELMAEIQPSPFDHVEAEKQRKKTALVVSICVGLYIFALLSCILIEELGAFSEDYAPISLFGISAVSTCILIYHFMSRPRYQRQEDTMVEEFKEWKSTDHKKRDIKGGLSAILWSLVVGVYFIISFTFMNWHVSWIVFLVGIVLNQIISLCVDMFPSFQRNMRLSEKGKKVRNSIISLIWSVIVMLYFLISFLTQAWHMSWIIFLAGAAITAFVNLLFQFKNN